MRCAHDDMLSVAFSCKDWRVSADALSELTGAAITVTTALDGKTLYASQRCTYCELFGPVQDLSPARWGCIHKSSIGGNGRETCVAGLPCYVAQIEVDGQTLAIVTIGGFVSTTRDRNRQFERLVASGADPDSSRQAVRELAVLSKRHLDALLRALVAQASATISRGLDGRSWQRRLRELEVFVDAGREFIECSPCDEGLEERVLARAMTITGAESGSLLLRRLGTDLIEVVAAMGGSRSHEKGDLLHLGEGIEGRVAQTGNSVLVTGRNECASGQSRGLTTATVSAPMRNGDEIMGVIVLTHAHRDRHMTDEELRLLERYASVAAVAIDNNRAELAARRAMSEMAHLGEFSRALETCSSVEDVAELATSDLGKTLGRPLCGVVLAGWGRDSAFVAVRGTIHRADIDSVIAEAAGRSSHDGPIPSLSCVNAEGKILEESPPSSAEEWSVLSSELTSREVVVGYLFVSVPDVGRFDSGDRNRIQEISRHVSAALERSAGFERLRDDYVRTIAALAVALDSTERVRGERTGRLSDYAIALGRELNLPPEDIESLRFAGLLHDIGPAAAEHEILAESRWQAQELSLGTQEVNVTRAGVVEQIEFLDAISPVVLHHHERWDGEGYPGGLSGTAIPRLARVLAVADAFDMMTSSRPFQPKLTLAQARCELEKGAGSRFDPQAVEAFLALLDRQAIAGATGLFAADMSDGGPRLPV